jgi:hypothetical protein
MPARADGVAAKNLEAIADAYRCIANTYWSSARCRA